MSVIVTPHEKQKNSAQHNVNQKDSKIDFQLSKEVTSRDIFINNTIEPDNAFVDWSSSYSDPVRKSTQKKTMMVDTLTSIPPKK